jgi:hypothetical protein
MLRTYSKDVCFRFSDDSSWAGEFHGISEVRAWLERFYRVGLRLEIDDILIAGWPWNTRTALHFEATSEVTPLLQGFGHLDRYSAVRDGALFEGITLRLFDPASGQWWIHWADTAHARTLLPPMTGRFLGGVGEFYGEEKVRATRCCAAFCGRDRGRTWLGGNRRSPKTAAGPGKRIGS